MIIKEIQAKAIRARYYGEKINRKEHAFPYLEIALMIKKPEWTLGTTVTKKIRVLDKDEEEGEINAFDSEMNMPFILYVPEGISMEEIEINRWYRAKFKVYTSKLLPEIEEEWSKMAKTTGGIREGIARMKHSGGYGTLYKFELVSLKST